MDAMMADTNKHTLKQKWRNRKEHTFDHMACPLCVLSVLLLMIFVMTGCSLPSAAGKDKNRGLLLGDDEIAVMKAAADQTEPYGFLSVPTCLARSGDLWLIADCYHNQIIFSDKLGAPLQDWKVLTADCIQPHTVSTDGTYCLVDDTEQNRVLVFRRDDHEFTPVQIFNDIGSRPHYTVYCEKTDSFYTLSSMTGEIYQFRKDREGIWLHTIYTVPRIADTYVRSFTIQGDKVYFVSGISSTGEAPCIVCCRLKDFSEIAEYPVHEKYAGMIELLPFHDDWLVTISTDLYGSQDAATMLRISSLDELSSGSCEEVYEQYFIGGGTPYYMTSIDECWYLTEHRLPGYSLWRFFLSDDDISDVELIY